MDEYEVSEAESGYCPHCDHHTIYKKLAEGPHEGLWYCFRCEELFAQAGAKPQRVPPSRREDNTVGYIPPEHRLRFAHAPGRSAQAIERDFKRAVAERREMAAGGEKDGARLAASIPAEYYHSKMKVDKNYWHDKKNVEREMKVWGH